MEQPTVRSARWWQWGDALLNSPKERMSDKLAETYLGLCMADEAKLKAVEGSPPLALQIFDEHALRVGLKADLKVRLLFSMAVSDRPGIAVMYVHALRRFQQKKGFTRPMNLMDLHGHNDSPFAFGYPSEETLHKLWMEQKCTKEELRAGLKGNYLDNVKDAL